MWKKKGKLTSIRGVKKGNALRWYISNKSTRHDGEGGNHLSWNYLPGFEPGLTRYNLTLLVALCSCNTCFEPGLSRYNLVGSKLPIWLTGPRKENETCQLKKVHDQASAFYKSLAKPNYWALSMSRYASWFIHISCLSATSRRSLEYLILLGSEPLSALAPS